ncbi:hypothetical protein TYRP_022371 [Tyrophagus putrescentiae]|nr:hypothetical protein TYRP_022371 [Tyrophagus putrescentiae]
MKMKVSFRSLPLKEWTIKFCWLLPKIILYLICLYLFYTNVKTLTSAFFRFNTTVVIRYETPETIYFPGLTICGCSLAEKFCDFSTLGDSDSEIADLTVRQLLLSEHYLVSACHFIYDSRQPEFKVPCSEVEPPLASLQNGRRCLTYFTRLNKLFKHHTINFHKLHHRQNRHWTLTANNRSSSKNMKMTNTEQYTWYVYLELNMSQPYDGSNVDVNIANVINSSTSSTSDFDDSQPNMDDYKSKLLDSDVLLALHTPNAVPSLLEADYMSIDLGVDYQIHFSKQITTLKPPPFQTKCREYSKKTKPRSSNECMSICQLQNDLQRECINPNVLVTKDLLALFDSHSPKMNSSNIKFCTTNCSVQQYIDYVSQRAICKSFCGM